MLNPAVESSNDAFPEKLLLTERLSYLASLSTLTIFCQGKLGPTIMGDRHLPFITNDHESDLQKLGSFFSVAIGQGSYYNTGCFGPLPALGSDYNCVVYSIIVKDNASFDQRMQGWNYILVCFFYHKAFNRIITGKKARIEECLDNYFQKNGNLDCLTLPKIEELKRKLLKFLAP